MSNQNIQDMEGEHRTTLKAFSRTLQREAHVLTKEPDLLWQQLYNRLQWEGEDVIGALSPELVDRSRPGARPWLRITTPYRDSEALIRTLEGQTQGVNACAYSPDGVFIVSTSLDDTLRVWEASTGQALHILKSHAGGVRTCEFSQDGRFIVSANMQGTLQVWEAATGQLVRSVKYPATWIYAFALSPDWRLIVSANIDNTLQLLDAASGQRLHTLKGHTELVTKCAF